MNKLYLYGGIVITLVLVGLAGGYYLYKPAPPKPETYAQAETQVDGSKVLERKPQADAKPAHKVLKGAKVERIMQVQVKPTVDLTAPADTSHECPAVDVDLSIVKMPDESRRVIASSPNGQVVGGVDIPVEATSQVKELKWAAGLSANPFEKTFGVFLDRDLGPFRVGAELNRIDNKDFDIRFKAGIRW